MSLKPLLETKIVTWVMVVLTCVLVGSTMILPLAFQARYASPDETAAVRVAELLSHAQSLRVPEPLAIDFPWLHPRSWVSHGSAIVPVGFLGWPALISPFVWLLGSRILPWLAWGWFLSMLFPFYRLLRELTSSRAAQLGVLALLATPMTLFYANRALFPNPAILAAFVWSLWAMGKMKEQTKYGWLAGLFMGMVIIIRPVELLWILPWWVWRIRSLDVPRRGWLRLLPAIFFLGGIFLVLNADTYGAWWKIGY